MVSFFVSSQLTNPQLFTMKNLVFAFSLLCCTSLVAQFSYNSTNSTGIESNTNTASGNMSFAVGGSTQASGDASTAMGILTIASGDNSTAMGDNTEASGQQSTAMGWQTTASGSRAIALGGESIASGSHSTAMGYKTIASGDASTAMGSNTTASGYASTASGQLSTAIGNYSTAMGYDAKANANGSLSAGLYSNANGVYSTSIGVFTNANGYASIALGDETDASGYTSTAMGKATIANGYYSTTMGYYTSAKGFGTTAIGVFNETDDSSNSEVFSYDTSAFVIGNGTNEARSNAFEVLFDGSTTVAGNVTAPAFIGDGSQLTDLPMSFNENGLGGIQSPSGTASGRQSTAMGISTTASGDFTTASGINSVASGFCSTALGAAPQAIGGWSTALGGFTIANGRLSTAMGEETVADDYGTTVIGVFNKIDETPNPDTFSFENAAFVIGNGGYDSQGNYLGGADEARSNAFEVLFDGTTTIAGDLNINSDARLKANIVSLGSTLTKLIQIDGKSYTMKKDESEKQKIGLLAQDIEKVFPELVSESHGVKSVNYQGLVPVLINALKEQDAMMKEQQAEIDKLKTQEERLDRLERLVAAMD